MGLTVDSVDGLGSVVLVVEVVGLVVVAAVVGGVVGVEATADVVGLVVGVVEVVGVVVDVVGGVEVVAGGVVTADVVGGVYCEVVAGVVASDPEEQLKPTSMVTIKASESMKYLTVGIRVLLCLLFT